jgi:hypothetical protein
MVNNTQPNTPRPVELLSKLLDKGYTDATAQVIRSIARDTQSGPLANRLKQFDERAAELAAAGEAMKADDPVLRALLADFGVALKRDALLIDAAAPDVQAIGIDGAGEFVRQNVLPGFSTRMMEGIGVSWNTPSAEAVQSVVQYTSGEAWQAELAKYADGIGRQAQEIAIRGIVSGKGPMAIARDLRNAIENMPAFQANNLMRTLQVTSFRDAAVMHQVANAAILETEVIRVAALDDRTCMACVALCGTRLKLGERVNDHWQGRCFSVTIVKGRPAPNVPNGEEWFEARTPLQQRQQMGSAAYEAWTEGAIALGDFPHKKDDALFGEIITENSLKGMLGDDAKQYYKNNRG